MRRNVLSYLSTAALAAALILPVRISLAQAPAAPVTLNLRDTPLRTALQMLFEGSGLQYAVQLEVPNAPVTLQIRDIPFQTALRTLLRLVPGITYRKEGDVYVIGLRPVTPEPTGYETEIPAPPETVAGGRVEVTERIPLNFLHPTIAAIVLGGQLIPTEDQVQPGFGGLGGGLGSYGGGYNSPGGGGGYGGPGGGGLGAIGNGGFLNGGLNGSGYGNGGGFSQGLGVGNGLNGTFGNSGFGQNGNIYANGPGNSLVVGPRVRRF
jgi:hypothetical protein